MTPETRARIQARAEAIAAGFAARGSVRVECDVLQPAETLLDLYGEDIRARAFITHDPLRGEMMLRPDFTVPVVEAHMAAGAGEASYHYLGRVFRKQEDDETRPPEYLQVGYERFGGDPAEADAEVFAALSEAVPDGAATVGDIGLLRAAVAGLTTSPERKAALLRHIWRPGRFKRLLDRFGGRTAPPRGRDRLLSDPDPLARVAEVPGKRRRAEIAARIETLSADAAQPPIPEGELALLDTLLALSETLPNVLSHLSDIALDMPSIAPRVAALEARAEALERAGVDVETLWFEAGHGRATMEYYDGFVFEIRDPARPHLPPLAQGGRYDALTRALGRGAEVPAVGGVVRPALLVDGEGAA